MKVALKQLALILLVGFIGLAASWVYLFAPLNSFASQDYPKVNSPTPTFTLPDVYGKQVHLSDFKNKRNVILVFYSHYKDQLVNLMNDYDKFKQYNAYLVLISPSDEKNTKEFLKIAAAELSLRGRFLAKRDNTAKTPFPVLIDNERKVAKLYGVLGEEAIPSVFVIDKEGMLRFKYIGQDSTDSPPTEHLIEMLSIASTKKSTPPTSAAVVVSAKNKRELERGAMRRFASNAFRSSIDKYMNSLRIVKPEGMKLTDFTLKTLDGKDVSLSDYRGKIVFLNFWTTWCPACRQEMPSMEKLYQKFKDKDFVMLAVSLREKNKTVEKFMEDYKLNFPALLDPKGRVGGAYLVTSIPTTYLISRQGEIIGKAIGGRDWASEDSFNLFSALLER
jgi:peroxiredoxin